MKRIICLFVVCVMLLCSSCQKGELTMFLGDRNNKYMDTCMGQVFEAIKETDADGLKAIFSQKARREAKNIDAEALLSFVQGEAVSWVRDESPVESEYVEYGEKTKELKVWCSMKTDAQDYLVFLCAYPVDTHDSTNVGLYTLMIITLDYENNLTGAMEDWVMPGIYIPELDSVAQTDR